MQKDWYKFFVVCVTIYSISIITKICKKSHQNIYLIMKKLISYITLFLFCSPMWLATFAQDRWWVWSTPKQILDHVVDNAETKDLETSLDLVNRDQWWFDLRYRIANTLDSVRANVAPYLQRLSFAILVAATTLIIYNGLRLVLSPLQPDEVANVKKRIVYIFFGLLVGTGFYYLIKVVLSVMGQISG